MANPIIYPVRINRYLALNGYCTRRDADKLIEAGKVLINGQIAKLGDKVGASDKVEVAQTKAKTYQYFAYNKPVDEVTPERDKHGLFPLGRLDKESRGLMILTNDGRLTDRLLNPEHDHEKEYLVTVDKPLKQTSLNALARGMQIEDERTQSAEVEQEDEYSFRIVLTEGKKHQIRRMCSALGYTVMDLVRLRIENVALDDLAESKTRPITGRVLQEFLTSLGLSN